MFPNIDAFKFFPRFPMKVLKLKTQNKSKWVLMHYPSGMIFAVLFPSMSIYCSPPLQFTFAQRLPKEVNNCEGKFCIHLHTFIFIDYIFSIYMHYILYLNI
jgi:hypothetical protein